MCEVIKKINELWDKGFRVCIYPQPFNGDWLWTAGVYVGNGKRAEWVDSDNGLPHAGYLTYEEAFNAVVDYCNNYKSHGKKGKV